MSQYKKYISSIFYVLALALTSGVGLFVIVVSKDFILESKGIGVYGVLIYYAAAFFSVVSWLISYLVFKNKKLALIYWVLFSIMTIFMVTQPTWWAAPPLETAK